MDKIIFPFDMKVYPINFVPRLGMIIGVSQNFSEDSDQGIFSFIPHFEVSLLYFHLK